MSFWVRTILGVVDTLLVLDEVYPQTMKPGSVFSLGSLVVALEEFALTFGACEEYTSWVLFGLRLGYDQRTLTVALYACPFYLKVEFVQLAFGRV